MAKEISTSIVIAASPEKVWEVLTRFSDYPVWNPFIQSLTGTVAQGKKITVHLQPPGNKGMTFKPIILTYTPNVEFSWLGHLLVPGLFDGLHRFELIDNGNGTTTFIQREHFKGLLVPFLKKLLDHQTKQGFMAMNEALKNRVEMEKRN